MSVEELTSAPDSFSVVTKSGRIQIQGSLVASCAPYRLSPALTHSDDLIEVTLTAQVVGSACPQDVVWNKGIRVEITGIRPGQRLVRVVHATDSSRATEVLVNMAVVVP